MHPRTHAHTNTANHHRLIIPAAMYVLAYLFAIEDSYGSHESIRSALGLTSTMYGLIMSYISSVPRMCGKLWV